jgi:hypothetical protein
MACTLGRKVPISNSTPTLTVRAGAKVQLHADTPMVVSLRHLLVRAMNAKKRVATGSFMKSIQTIGKATSKLI